jgi:hypothetical protein
MKGTGLGDNFYLDGVDLSGDLGSLGAIGGGLATTQAVTGIDKSAFERLGLGRDGRIEFVSFFNDAAGQAHPTLKTLPTADRIASYFRGTTLGGEAASEVAKQVNYDPSRGNDGSLTLAIQALANGYGLEWGRMLTAGKRTDTTATNGASVDHTDVTTAFGWQAWLHVFAFTGTSVTVTLQDSADDAAFANLTGGAFTAVSSAPASQRLEGGRTATVRRYLRAITSGTFSNATFAVVFTRNLVAVAY